MNMPLSVVLERTKLQLIQSFNQVIAENKLPAYLYEGILLDILSDARSRKNLELVADLSNYQAQSETEQTSEEQPQPTPVETTEPKTAKK